MKEREEFLWKRDWCHKSLKNWTKLYVADGTARSSGGGNSLKPSHNQDFSLIEAFNNLALWGEKKFVSELKRTYKFQRGVNNK